MGLTSHTYAELVVARESELCRTPDRLEDIQAAAIPLVSLTGTQLIERVPVRHGQRVLVTGALGGVGRTACFVAQFHGAHVIAGIRAKQKQAAEALDADEVVALDDREALAHLAELDVLADTVGKEPTQMLLPRIKKGGTLSSVVGAPEEAKGRDFRIEAFMAQPDSARLKQLAEDVATGKLRLPVARVFKFSEIREAHKLAEKGGCGKLVRCRRAEGVRA